MRDRPLLYLCLVIAAAVMLSVLFGGERFIRELRPSALEKNISEGESVIVRGQVYRIEQKEDYQVLYLEKKRSKTVNSKRVSSKKVNSKTVRSGTNTSRIQSYCLYRFRHTISDWE